MFHSKIQKDGSLSLSSLQKQFLVKHAGKEVKVEVDETPTSEMRRFFEGAIVPYAFYQSDLAWEDFRETREALKLEFNFAYTLDLGGKRAKVAKSTTTLSKERFKRFLDEIEAWFRENGYEFPDPEQFKAWRDSAPDANEIYPPLQRLIDAKKKREEDSALPWARKDSNLAKKFA